MLAAPLAASDGDAEPKLKIHGYLTQAYAWSDLGDDPELRAWLEGGILGIEEGGTTDYRTLALQIRYDFDAQSSVVFQFDHERLGASPDIEGRDEIEVDWAFFNHRFKQGTSVRVGRLPLPWGIYNEIRDVGTLLPFFRPVDDIYAESESFDESFDGVQLTHTFFATTAWPLEVALFGGQSNQDAVSVDSMGVRTRAPGTSDRFGTRLWLETPVPGLTFGFGVVEETQKGGLLADGEREPNDRWIVSVEGDFDRLLVRGEYFEQRAVFQNQSFGRSDFDKRTFYLETVLRLRPDVELLAAYVDTDDAAFIIDDPVVNPVVVSASEVDVSSGTDLTLGLRYLPRPNVAVRAEYHLREEAFPRFSELELTPRPDGRLSLYVPSGKGDANFGIVSLSVSF